MPEAKKLFKYQVPKLEDYIGRYITIEGEKIQIKHLVGNIGMVLGRSPKDQRPQYLEINGNCRISALRFFNEMNGGSKVTGITEQEMVLFEEMEFWSEKMGEEERVKKLVNDVIQKVKKEK